MLMTDVLRKETMRRVFDQTFRATFSRYGSLVEWKYRIALTEEYLLRSRVFDFIFDAAADQLEPPT